jgi:hypothetical protein
MDNALVTLIAVAGTLLASVLGYIFQRRQQDLADRRARSDQLRQERITIYSEFAEAVAQLRGASRQRQIMRQKYGPESREFLEARAENNRIQPIARARMYRVHLVGNDPELLTLSRQAIDATISIQDAESDAELLHRSEMSRRLTDDFVAAAAVQLQNEP